VPESFAQKLGYNVTVVPPGKRAFPFRHHRANAEMFRFVGRPASGADYREGDWLRRSDVAACESLLHDRVRVAIRQGHLKPSLAAAVR